MTIPASEMTNLEASLHHFWAHIRERAGVTHFIPDMFDTATELMQYANEQMAEWGGWYSPPEGTGQWQLHWDSEEDKVRFILTWR